MCELFRNGHGICLKELSLCRCEISSHQISIFCKVLEDKLCPHLTCLNFSGNNIADEGLIELCHTLSKQKLLKLTKLDLSQCSLTNECVPALCELLTNECCNLIDLSLKRNSGIKEKGLHILCKDALTKEHCKLEKLVLSHCSLTDDSLPELCNALQDEHCKLARLKLSKNKITDKGLHMLCELALTKVHCNLVELHLTHCSLTDDCLPELCNALQDKHCKLTSLKLSRNKITDKGLDMLCELALTKEHCKLVELDLGYCSLTDECIPDLRKTLQDEHCRLKKLTLFEIKFTEKGIKSIDKIAAHGHCKTRGLMIHT